jgi:hypothetical protein
MPGDPVQILVKVSGLVASYNASVLGSQENTNSTNTPSTTSNPSGPMAWWKLNEGTGTTVTDSSGNDFSGTINGATWVNDQTGNSLYFNGNSSYVSLPSLDLTNADSLTVVAWINSDLDKVGFIIYNGNLGEFEMGNGDLGEYTQSLNINPTHAGFSVHLSDFNWYGVSSPTPMQPNVWHQIVGEWVKGTSLKVYVDGVLAGENDEIPSLRLYNPGPGFPSSLGIYSQNQWGQQDFFKGRMSNVMVYDRALTSQEIQTLDIQFSNPVAAFTSSPTVGSVDSPITFNASLSQPSITETQPAAITTYNWNFGDGNSQSTNRTTTSHTYTTQNAYNVTLTVSDPNGNNSSTSQIIQVEMPTSISLSSAASTLVGSPVNITGDLTDLNNNPLSSQIVVLYYTFPGINSWIPISSSATDLDGTYNIQWVNTATGIFTLMVQWQGNDTYFGTNNTITLCSLPCQNQSIFLIESNSTISGLAYNTTSYQLGFTANCASGTSGYVKIAIAKNLINNIDSTTVELNGNQTPYSTSFTSDSWLLKFNYAQSSDEFTVNLPVGSPVHLSPSPSPPEQPPASSTLVPSRTPIANSYSDLIPYAIIVLAIGLGVNALVYYRKRKQ